MAVLITLELASLGDGFCLLFAPSFSGLGVFEASMRQGRNALE